MALKGVVPNDWRWDEGMPFMQSDSLFVAYEDRISFLGNRDILEVEQTHQDLTIGGDYETPELVVRYVASLAPDVFRLAGMAWTIIIPIDNPIAWIRDRFFRPEVFSEKWDQISALPAMRFVADGENVSYGFYPQLMPTENREEEDEQVFLGVLCRLGFAQLDDDAELSRWVLDWRTHEKTAVSNLKHMLGVENGLE